MAVAYKAPLPAEMPVPMLHSCCTLFAVRVGADERHVSVACAWERDPRAAPMPSRATPARLPTMRTIPGSLAACRQRGTKGGLQPLCGRDADVLTTRGIKKAVAVCGPPIWARQNPQTLKGRTNKPKRIRFKELLRAAVPHYGAEPKYKAGRREAALYVPRILHEDEAVKSKPVRGLMRRALALKQMGADRDMPQSFAERGISIPGKKPRRTGTCPASRLLLCTCRITASTPAFQAGRAGSTPAMCSMPADGFR